ncbi:MAG TPA: hypothetical protein VGV12_04255 [Gemmatimonadales bacterium]|nr:hypothetical protein [Gemmatimonadales bacterium]
MAFFYRRVLGVAVVAAAMGASTAAAQGSPSPWSVGATVYAQYVYQLKDTNSVKQNNFDVTRGYLNLIGRFSGGVYTRVTVDLFSVSAAGTGGTAGSYAYRLKYAYAAWTPTNSPLTYKLGMIHTPWLDWEEALWDYRMQGTMALDRNGYESASDIGAGIDGKWKSDKVNFQATIVNGEGYHGGVGDGRKDVEGRVSVRVMDTDDSSRVGGLRITAYAHAGKPTGSGTRNRWLGMVSYRAKQYTLAAEATAATDSTTGAAKRDGHIYSAFGVYHVPRSGVSVIARVDAVTPIVAGNRLTRYIAGLSYQINPQLRVLADWDYLNYKNAPATPDLTRSQALFQTQFVF